MICLQVATDAIAMQHDVDYTVCGDDKKCKHRADDRMVRALRCGTMERTSMGALDG